MKIMMMIITITTIIIKTIIITIASKSSLQIASNKISKGIIVLHIAHGINNFKELLRKYFLLLLNKQHNQLLFS